MLKHELKNVYTVLFIYTSFTIDDEHHLGWMFLLIRKFEKENGCEFFGNES